MEFILILNFLDQIQTLKFSYKEVFSLVISYLLIFGYPFVTWAFLPPLPSLFPSSPIPSLLTIEVS